MELIPSKHVCTVRDMANSGGLSTAIHLNTVEAQ